MPVDESSILVAANPAEAGRRAAECFIDALNDPDHEHRERRFVALAGGRTPTLCYRALTEPPLRDRFDPARVEWFFSDERCVPPDHPDSNFGLAQRALFEPLAIPPDRVHRMPADEDDLEPAAAGYEQTLRVLLPAEGDGPPVFDLIFLGLGADGHTASLFPGSAAVAERQHLVVAHRVESLDTWRMTMTFPLLWAARRLIVLTTGADKADAVAAVLSPEPDAKHWPAAALRDGTAAPTWVLDADAARLVRQAPRA